MKIELTTKRPTEPGIYKYRHAAGREQLIELEDMEAVEFYQKLEGHPFLWSERLVPVSDLEVLKLENSQLLNALCNCAMVIEKCLKNRLQNGR